MGSPVVLGLDFGGSKTAAAVVDATGVRMGDIVIPNAPDAGATQTFANGVAAAHALLARVAGGEQLAGVGACTFGIPYRDRVELAPTIPGWEQLPFGDALRQAFPGTPVRIDTDVKAAARTELDDGALAGCATALYVNLGTGFAVALITGGAVVPGHHGAAGEIGYNLRAGGGRLEDAIGGLALERDAAAATGGPDIAALFERGESGDPAAARARNAFVDELGFHLVNLSIALDPQRIAFGGGLVRSWARFGPALQRRLADAVPFPPEAVLAAHPYDAPLRGALALGRAAISELPTVASVLSEGAPA